MSDKDESPDRFGCDSDPWLNSPAPACVDSLVACSSITPEVRATISVWSRGAPWLHPLSEETPQPTLDSSVTLSTRNVRRNVWVCTIIVMVGMLGAAIVVTCVALNSSKSKSPPSTTLPLVAPTSHPPFVPSTLGPVTTAAPVNLLSEPGALVFVNECTTEATVYFTRTLPNATSEVSSRELNSTKYVMVVPGKNWDDFIAADFRLGKSILATNFAANRAYGQVFYSISTRNGFNVPVEVAPMRADSANEGCPVLRCDAKDCEKAMRVRYDCKWFEALQITFCPRPNI